MYMTSLDIKTSLDFFKLSADYTLYDLMIAYEKKEESFEIDFSSSITSVPDFFVELNSRRDLLVHYLSNYTHASIIKNNLPLHIELKISLEDLLASTSIKHCIDENNKIYVDIPLFRAFVRHFMIYIGDNHSHPVWVQVKLSNNTVKEYEFNYIISLPSYFTKGLDKITPLTDTIRIYDFSSFKYINVKPDRVDPHSKTLIFANKGVPYLYKGEIINSSLHLNYV